MNKDGKKLGLLRLHRFLLPVTIVISISSGIASANGVSRVQAVPDYGDNDCVSFKYGSDTSPLNFTFGYACASENFCEVSAHGCIDESCHNMDYSRGVRAALTTISIASRVNEISMGATGKDLSSNDKWCLVQDGAGNFWALDKQRGNSESFNLYNQNETVVPCKMTDYFRGDIGCVADTTLH